MQSTEIRTRIRAMLTTGELPCDEPQRTWAGNGEGHLCVACTERIPPSEVEYEVQLPSGVAIRLHRACHAIWLEECESIAS